jgi:hypothetical protein
MTPLALRLAQPQLCRAAATSVVKVHGFCGAFWPCSAFGRPSGNLNDARDQNQRAPDAEQTFTGWLNVTTAGTGYTGPAAQLGLQASTLYVPVPTASVADHMVQFIWCRIVLESPDSGQPELPHAGSCHAIPLTSWPSARKVSAAVCEVTGVLAVPDAGDPAELADELHAVTSKAAQARAARAAVSRARCQFVVPMVVQPLNSVSGSASHVIPTTSAGPPWLERRGILTRL